LGFDPESSEAEIGRAIPLSDNPTTNPIMKLKVFISMFPMDKSR
jgi:hypothetical protein